MTGFLKMEGEDFAAFAIAAGVGYVVGSVTGDSELAVACSIVVSYHLFLGWLVMKSSGKASLAMSLPMTLLTHASCMVVALGPALIGTHRSLGFSVFRYSIAALALFERGWLFSYDQQKTSAPDVLAAQPPLSIRPTLEDEIEWVEYLSKRRPGMTKPGTTVRQEHEAWLRARHAQRLREQAAAAQQQPPKPVGEDGAVTVS